MKRIDYFWPRAAVQTSAIIFITQLVTETVAIRKEGFEWVLPLCFGLLAVSVLWIMFCMCMNAYNRDGEES